MDYSKSISKELKSKNAFANLKSDYFLEKIFENIRVINHLKLLNIIK